ncbi:MAG: 2-phospho-L-lactate transferase [Acidimicrobiales bacterium]
MIAVLSGGVGAAKFLSGLVQVVDPAEVVAVVNTGDDTIVHGLYVSPDLDTVTYTLAGRVNPETGWGIASDSFTTMAALESLGGETWFRLGDLDLATHLYRTGALAAGATLSEVTASLADAFGLAVRLLPMSDDPVRTRLVLAGEGGEIDFQEYFVHRRHDVAVTAVRFEGAGTARPAPGVLDALDSAEVLVVAPSNPVLSIGPILSVPGVAEVLRRRREDCVAVSPIVAGAALKGPADRLLSELGEEVSVVGVARRLSGICGTLVVDVADEALAGRVEEAGTRCVAAPAIMSSPGAAADLARVAVGSLAGRSR